MFGTEDIINIEDKLLIDNFLISYSKYKYKFIHELFDLIEDQNVGDIQNLLMFKNIGDLFISDQTLGDNSSEYEDQFESWVQKIDSNPIIFGYIQYIEKFFPEFVKVIRKDNVKALCIIILSTIDKDNNLPKTIPSIDSVLKLFHDTGVVHTFILPRIFNFVDIYIEVTKKGK